MTQSADLIAPRLLWADRGMIHYLHAVGQDSTFNTQVAKVYYQSGAIHASIKHIPACINPRTVELEIERTKKLLEEKIAQQVARRLDNALQGET